MKVIGAEFRIEGLSESVSQLALLQLELDKVNKGLRDAKRDGDIDTFRNLKEDQVGLRKEIKDVNRDIRDQQKALDKIGETESVYINLTRRLSDVKFQLKEIEVSGGEAPKELVKEFQDLDETLRKAENRVGEFQRSVGEYPDLFREIGGSVEGLRDRFRLLLRSPLLAFFALIAGALALIGNAFSRSEKATQLFATATGVVNGIMSSLVGLVDRAADGLISFAEDPLQGIRNLGTAIVNNILNRVVGVIDVVVAAGEALGNLATLNFDELAVSADKAAVAVAQIVTGLDETQQNNVIESVKELTEEINENVEASIKLEQARIRINIQNQELAKSLESLRSEEQLLQTIADDTTLSFARREEAAEQARKATEEAAQREIQIARNNLNLINQEIAIRRRNGEQIEDIRDQQTTAITSLIVAERELTLAVRDNERTRSELRQDRLERDLDILIDGFDNQKTINERLIADDRRTFTERQKILDETEELSNRSFDKQIETIQQFTGVRVDANELLQTSDAVQLNERIRSLGLSEIIEGRLLEVIRDRRTAVQDLTESQEDLNRAQEGQDVLRIEENANQRLAELLTDSNKTAQEVAFERERIESQTNIDILNARLRSEQLTSDEVSKIRLELAEAEADERKRVSENALQEELFSIQQRESERLRLITESGDKEEEISKNITEAKVQFEIEALQARLELEELSKQQRLSIEDEIFNKKVQLLNQEREANKKTREEIQTLSLDLAEETASAVSQIRGNRAEQEFQEREEALNNQLALDLEAAEGNEAEQQRIREDFAAAEEQLQTEQANFRKEQARKEVLIQGALAIIRTFANFGFPAGLIPAAGQAIQTGLQLAVVESQQFADSGRVKGFAELQQMRNGKVRGNPNHSRTAKGDNMLVLAKPNEMFVNENSQRLAERIYGMDIWRNINIPEFADGGVVAPQVIPPLQGSAGSSVQTVNSQAKFSESQMQEFGRTVAKETAREVRTALGLGLQDSNRRAERESLLSAQIGA